MIIRYSLPMLVGLVSLLWVSMSSAEPDGPTDVEVDGQATDSQEEAVQLHGSFLSLSHFRTDSDFDPSERYFDLDGQSEGQAATFFQPRVLIDAGKGVRLLYEM